MIQDYYNEVSKGNTINNLTSVFFVDENTGWVCGTEGLILQTTDGGRNWNPQNYEEDFDFYCIYFPDKDNGWICGNDGIILHTKNGGSSWEDQRFKTKIVLNSLFFINKSSGWVCGQNGTILKTDDGGEHWDPWISGRKHWLNKIIFFLEKLLAGNYKFKSIKHNNLDKLELADIFRKYQHLLIFVK